jgi:CDP-diglyceride synthetase
VLAVVVSTFEVPVYVAFIVKKKTLNTKFGKTQAGYFFFKKFLLIIGLPMHQGYFFLLVLVTAVVLNDKVIASS